MKKKEFVLWYLSKKKVDYIQNMFREWKKLCFMVGHSSGDYSSFRVLINKMKNEGLVKVVKTEPSRFMFDRVYYTLTEKGLNEARKLESNI